MGVERETEGGMGCGRPGEQGQCQEHTQSESWHQNVRKNATHKEKSLVQRVKFNGRPKLPGWLGERSCSTDSGPGVGFIEGGG
jgi:hypothetical protein